jgi:NADP-dependent 3-hydroxy acid dehydrogenase YdfG
LRKTLAPNTIAHWMNNETFAGTTQLEQRRDAIAMPPDAVARAIAFAIEQPADVDVGEIVVRPTAQD